jgi:predicted nucleic acid-binding protein
MADALAVAERRSVLASDDVDRAAADIEQLLLQALDVDGAVVSVRQSLATARAFQLSAYDAAYLDLARREKLPLATLDDHLRAAATRAGVAVLR